MSDDTTKSANATTPMSEEALDIAAVKAAILEDISESTWQKIRQLGNLKLYLVGPDPEAEAPPKPARRRVEEPTRHVSDDEWHARHP